MEIVTSRDEKKSPAASIVVLPGCLRLEAAISQSGNRVTSMEYCFSKNFGRK